MLAGHFDETVIRACRILFGPAVSITPEFVNYLEDSGVKSAYRKRALETHPDRVVAFGPRAVSRQTSLFVQVNEAYERLNAFMHRRTGPPVRAWETPAPQKPRERPESRFYSGNIPNRPLLLGEFLYYSGVVPQHALTSAIAWQRRQRPKFGEIALRWRLLSDAQLADLLRGKRFSEPIGERAVRLMLLSRFQMNTILHFQRKKQPLIGAFFLENGHVMHFMLKRLLHECIRHNEQFRSLTVPKR